MKKIKNKKLLLLVICFLMCIYMSVDNVYAGKGLLTGKVISKGGGPLSAGIVLVYKKNKSIPFMPEMYRLDPDESAFIKADGTFAVQLSEGTYYLEVIERESNEIIGPPVSGEYQCISRNESGKPAEHIVKAGEENDIGVVSGFSRYKKMSADSIYTGITGKVLDSDGKPVPDAVVFAYSDASISGNALFISDKTGSDGEFVLAVNKGGEYYLKVVDLGYDGPSRIGIYGDDEPEALAFKAGDVIRGLDIRTGAK